MLLPQVHLMVSILFHRKILLPQFALRCDLTAIRQDAADAAGDKLFERKTEGEGHGRNCEYRREFGGQFGFFKLVL